MKKIFYSLSFLAIATLAGGLTSCQSEDILTTVNEEMETLEATAQGSFGSLTRTSFPVTESSVKFNWSADDQIVIISEDGTRNIGVMKLTSGAGASMAQFDGNLRTYPSDTKAHVYYFGQNKKSGLNLMMIDENFLINDQNATHANLTDYGIMHALANLERVGGKVKINFEVESNLAYAHYAFHLPEGVSATNEKITVGGANVNNHFKLNFADNSMSELNLGSITINPEWNVEESDGNGVVGSAYMVFVPANGIAPEFSLTIGEKTYKATLPSTEYEPNDFICGGNPAHGKDVYFSEDGSWTLTYMNGDAEFYTDSKTNYGPSCDFTITDKVPSQDAMTFLGWSTTPNGPVEYNANDQYTATRPYTDVKLYAVYEATKTTITLIGDVNGGDGSNKKVIRENATWPQTISTNEFGVDPTREGFEFKGWTLTKDGNDFVTEYTFNYNETSRTVYAKWESVIYSLEIICDNNGGKWVTEDNTNWGRDTSLPYSYKDLSNFETPVRTGYTFKGWSLTPNGNLITEVTFVASDDSDGDHKISKTIYAVWRDNNVTTSGNVTIEDATGTGY